MRFHRVLSLSVVLTFLATATVQPQTVVVLVRHAEKVDESRDPDLNDRGKERARALAAMLKDAGVESFYSTDYIRTRETARPLAELASKKIEIYDGDELEKLAAKIRSQGARTLVVGHSNTTPDLVRMLGGGEGAPIGSEEYDRLYLLVLLPDGTAATTILRF